MSDLSALPVGWKTTTLSEVVDRNRRITYGIVQPGPRFDPDRGVPMIRGQDYSSGTVSEDDLYYVSPHLAASFERAAVRGGDLLLSIVGYVGLVAEVPSSLTGANLTQTTARLAIRGEFESRYFLHYLRSQAFRLEVKKYTKGSAQPGLNLADVEKMRVSIPEDRQEQAVIARVLDTLDTAICETEAIIAKLKAVKHGLLHDLLTRGIDAKGELRPPQPEAPHLYKQSTLGWIPLEWEVSALASVIARLDAGVSVNSEDRPHGAGEIGVLKTSALKRGLFLPDENKTVVPSEIRLAREPVLGDSILVSRMNTPDLVGESCYVSEDWPSLFLPDRIWQFKKTSADAVHMRWLSYVLQTSSYRAYVQVHATGTSGSMKNLPKSRLLSMPVAFPPVAEQEVAAQRLGKIDDLLLDNYQAECAFSALKIGLMDDLLTGRVRVNLLLSADQTTKTRSA